MRHTRSLAWLTLILLTAFGLRADSGEAFEDAPDSQGGIIIGRFVQATQSQSAAKGPMEMDIDANVPRLNEHGRLRALWKISEVGKITYRILGFEGDNSVKSQVIARYLQAEQQGQNDQSLTLTPANYKFKLKGQRTVPNSGQVYIFLVSPRAKRVGLYKGELWLDSKTYLPVFEKGRLVRNPSVFFRKVDFERDFAILDGSAVPAHMSSTIDTRLVGRVNLRVAYTSPANAGSGAVTEVDPAITAPSSSLP